MQRRCFVYYRRGNEIYTNLRRKQWTTCLYRFQWIRRYQNHYSYKSHGRRRKILEVENSANCVQLSYQSSFRMSSVFYRGIRNCTKLQFWISSGFASNSSNSQHKLRHMCGKDSWKLPNYVVRKFWSYVCFYSFWKYKYACTANNLYN